MRNFLFNHGLFFGSFFLLWTFGVICWLTSDKGALLYWFSEHRSGLWDGVFRVWTLLGEAWLFVAMIVILLIKSKDKAIAVAIGGLLSLLIGAIMKTVFEIPRPRLWLLLRGELSSFQTVAGHPIRDGYNSFPSGHAIGAFVLASLLSLMFPKYRLVFLFLAIGVAMSRIYLGHHFLEDVLMGSITGVLIGATTYIIVDSMKGRTRRGISDSPRSGKMR